MTRRVAIVGIGYTPARAVSPDVSYREMIYEAACRAYQDAGVKPADVQSFVCCAEDFNEGISISDEYTPDQLGAVRKPVHTVGGDGLHGLADATMEIMTGLVDLVVVEAHSKASNILTPNHIMHYALDPVTARPLGLNPHFVAGLEMSAFMHETGTTPEQVGGVVVKNKTNALRNPHAAHPARVTLDDVIAAPPVAAPLNAAHIARSADAAYVVVVASEARARALSGKPVWIRGVGWSNDTPTLESRNWARATYCEQAAERAYRMADIRNPADEIDLFEVDDTYAYKELQHLRALGVGGKAPVNVSGGALGMGHTLDATGLARVVELALQLRGKAGERQVDKARVGLAQSWRGVPTTSGAVAILSAD